MWRVIGALAAAACLAGGPAAAQPREARGLTGQLLVATPELPDPRFMRTVLYVARHDDKGTLGFVLNRPMSEIPLSRVLMMFGLSGGQPGATVKPHYGGPVERTRGMVLHTDDYREKSTIPAGVKLGITWGPDLWLAIAEGKGPRRARLFLGRSGWGVGQLEREISGGHWVIVPADEALIFDDDYDQKWPRAMARRRTRL